MAKNHNIKKENTELSPEIEVSKKKDKQYKVRTDLGFEKRNYFIDGRNILLIAGESVDHEVYELFNEYCRKIFFE